LRLGLQPLVGRKRRFGLLALAAVLISGCGSGKTAGTTTRPTAAPNRSPTELALAHVHAEQTQSARVSTSAVFSPEGGGPTTVTILQEGLADDSVAAVRTVLRYEPDGDGWRLVSSERTQRCRSGRGHQDFSAADCV
jgi:hypothetical protein